MNKYYRPNQASDVKNWIDTTLVAYLKANPEDQTEIEHILDYFDSDKRPKRISKMSYEQAKSNTEKWNKTLIKKGQNLIETEEDTEVVLDFKNGNKLVKLLKKAAYAREGALMRHCVASYYEKNDVEIYSLRDYKNNPHCTIEVQKNDGMINQVKGKGNGSIHPKYIKYVLKSLNKLGVDVRESEMKNLGYEVLDKNFMIFLEQHFEGIKTLTFKNNKYFYLYSKLIRK